MKKIFQNNSIIKIFSLTMIVFMLMFAGVAHAQYSWAPPTGAPPLANTPPPVNVSVNEQTKSGWLQTKGFFSDFNLGAHKIAATEFCLESSTTSIMSWTKTGTPIIPSANCVTPTTGWGTDGGTVIADGTLGYTLYWDGTAWTPSNQFFNNAIFTAAFNFFLPGLASGSTSAVAVCVEPDGRVVTCGTSTPVCSDTSDNDSDGLVDASDPGCHTDFNAGNNASYDPYGTSEYNAPPSGHPNFYGQLSTGNISYVTGPQVASLASVLSNDGTTNGAFKTFHVDTGKFVYYAHPTNEDPVLISFNIGSPGGVGANWAGDPPTYVDVPINGSDVSYKLYKKPNPVNSTGTAYLKAD